MTLQDIGLSNNYKTQFITKLYTPSINTETTTVKSAKSQLIKAVSAS